MDENEEPKQDPAPSPFAPAEYSSIPTRFHDDPAPRPDPAPAPEEPAEPAEPEPVIPSQEDDAAPQAQEDAVAPAAASVPDAYQPPTTDGSGFADVQRHAKQLYTPGDVTFDLAPLTWGQRRDLSYRLTQLNVQHRLEGTNLVATLEGASTVQGQIDDLVQQGSPVEEVAEWIAPSPVEPAPVVDPPVVARSEPEEIVVPASTDIDAVIEATAADQELDVDEDEIVFDLVSLSTEERRHLTMRLTGAGIAHYWEVATDLVVAVKDAPQIERYIQEVQNPDGFADEELAEFDADEDVDDEGIYAAMSALYVAADKLMQKAKDPSIRTAFYDSVDDVDGLPAPFGFDPRVWSQVQELANAIADKMDEGADDDTVSEDARTLRQLLVNYV